MVKNGYTFAELLVVLSIVGILAAFGGNWLLSQMPAYRLNGAARLIRSDFLSARMKAVTQGNKFRVIFEEPYRYTILDDNNNNGKADVQEPVEFRDLDEEYQGVTVKTTNNPIFHPRGIASNLATVTVGNSAGQRTITVSMTGRVKISTTP